MLKFIKKDKRILTDNQRNQISGPVTEEELNAVFKKIKKKKSSPGPDGITYKFIQTYSTHLRKPIMDITNAIMQTGILPKTMQPSLIKLIPKKDIPKAIDDYRAITLTNCFLRIASSIINNRLIPFLPKLIHPNQTGFIPTRRMDDNILALQSMINHVLSPYAGTIQLDFKKAFDKISFNFIRKTLAHKNLPPNIISFITSLEQQHGRVLINNHQSMSFNFNTGVRQGNPISPTVFVLTIEPLLENIRQNLRGILIDHSYGVIKETLSSFADDISVFFQSTDEIHKLFAITDCFNKFSNMELNKKKTKIIFFKHHPSKIAEFEKEFPECPVTSFEDDPDLTYLGITPKGIQWKDLTKEIINQITQAIILHEPITIQTEAISIYCLSRIYFRDIFDPIPPNELTKILNTIKARIPNVNIETLLTPKKFGGFALMDLRYQLLGKRAKIIFFVFTQSSLWFYRFFRIRIQTFIDQWLKYHKETLHPYVKANQIIAPPPPPSHPPNRLMSLTTPLAPSSPFSQQIHIPWWQLLDGTLTSWINKNPMLKQDVKLSIGEDSSSWEVI